MKNQLYGKQMENVRKRCNVKLLSKHHNFKHIDNMTGENMITIIDHVLYKQVVLNKPTYGFEVLELSKLLMYTFSYDDLNQKYGNHIKLLATDTDSLMIYFETDYFIRKVLNILILLESIQS